jgi:AcrR family transcriptional regulator
VIGADAPIYPRQRVGTYFRSNDRREILLGNMVYSMKKDRERKERLSGEERRTRIIDAALKLFADKGFSGTRTREIAELAEISETLIFQHFKTKADLYREALGELFSHHPVMPEVEEKMAKKDDFDVFSTLALHVIRHNRQDRRIMRLAIFSALEGFHFAEMAGHGEEKAPVLPELLGRYIQRRIDEGAFKRVNAQIAGQLFIETIFMYVADQEVPISGPPLSFSDEETVETLVRIFLDGLKP